MRRLHKTPQFKLLFACVHYISPKRETKSTFAFVFVELATMMIGRIALVGFLLITVVYCRCKFSTGACMLFVYLAAKNKGKNDDNKDKDDNDKNSMDIWRGWSGLDKDSWGKLSYYLKKLNPQEFFGMK